jgi:GDPmannose 4,6-dehydratase
MKKALITGITGQDGSYLAEMLLSFQTYEVHGIVRRSATGSYRNLETILPRITLHYGDLTNENHLSAIIHDVAPDEIYNLAAQSDVGVSFQDPEYTCEATAAGFARLLEAVRKFSPHSKIYQASTSELFGNSPPPQNELTSFRPGSPYAAAKMYAHNMARIYREAYGMFISCGILFNHESPRRGPNFVTRKITRAVASIKKTGRGVLPLGNIRAVRDWGYAPDYVRAMWLILQDDVPRDYVIGTGEAHTVEDFLDAAFSEVGLDWRQYVIQDPKLIRPLEVNYLCADSSKAKELLGWTPCFTFQDLVRIMVKADLEGKE